MCTPGASNEYVHYELFVVAKLEKKISWKKSLSKASEK